MSRGDKQISHRGLSVLSDAKEKRRRDEKRENLNALNTIGYKEIFDYLDNKISLEESIEKIKINTRRFAKRQITWFGKDKTIIWFLKSEKNKIVDLILK